MNSKWKKSTAALLLALMLPVAPVAQASGIPTFDGAAMAQMIKDEIVNAYRWGQQAAHYVKQIQNWKENLRNYIRGRIGKILGINLGDQFTMEDLQRLLEKRKARCSSLGNSESRALCHQTLSYEIEKVKTYGDMEKMVTKSYAELDKLVNEYNQIRSGSNRSGEADSKQKEILTYIQNFENNLKMHEQKLKMIDLQQNITKEARVAVAKDQIRSTNLARTVSQGAVIGVLKVQAGDYKDKAEKLRNDNAKESNRNFVR